MTKKVVDWSPKLNAYINQASHRYNETGFVWGEFDCCTFAFDWVKIATGVDPMAAFRGKYSTQRGAAMALRRYGSGTLLKTVKDKFGGACNTAHAMRGDLAWRQHEGCLGIFVTRQCRSEALFLHDTGFGYLRASEIQFGFHI